ncbi:MAG: tRNA uridine-5-carboxymethylaminomethyl(34) synthesis GTPase MnmE [Candidatus Omnitrophica bacterium]|nr:tRNA uridine-5-carboxymethylaminomethyl(34) synthesis GTPase MnmE [Candidatus Omnitrophota bacterium]
MAKINTDDTIAAIATPVGEGGIGIVRLSGPSSLAIADKIFDSASGEKLSRCAAYTTHYGKIKDPKTSEIVDEVIVTVMRAPKSYTREDVVEINCHGGLQPVKKTLELTLKNGARIADPGEFTKRAFLNGRIDLVQAEAVLDVIRSKTEASLKVAMTQLEGELSARINAIREEIIDITSELEADIDFSEEEAGVSDRKKLFLRTGKIITDLEKLINTYDGGSILREGVLAVICGKPNVGKSSLMNLLLKRDRVIVSPIPGTTRDTIEEMISLNGIPIRLVDTAGITDTKDMLEKEGVARSRKYLAMADIVVLILDHSTRIDRADREIIKMCAGKKKIVALNKTDLAGKIDAKDMRALLKKEKFIKISVGKRKNIDLLENALTEAVWSGGFTQGEPAILSNARHKGLLDKALANMLSVKEAFKADEGPETIAIDLKEAIAALGLVIGKTISDDILDRIFERFCIGK